MWYGLSNMAALLRRTLTRRVHKLAIFSASWTRGRKEITQNRYRKFIQFILRQRNTTLPLTLLGLGWFTVSPNKAETTTEAKEMSDEELAIIETDKLFDENEIEKLYESLMRFNESQNPEIVWRLARAARNKAELCESTEDKKKFTYQAYEFAQKAVELDDKNFACHKWLGITISNVGDFEATKIKIQNAFKIRDHFQKAIELNPNDATCRYLLGLWCFTFADMPWYQQKLAAAVFATPPSSSYQEALDHFEMAEALEANFFSKNHVMLGKTNLRMKKYDEAKVWLTKAKACTANSVDDKQAKKEADDLLKSL